MTNFGLVSAGKMMEYGLDIRKPLIGQLKHQMVICLWLISLEELD